MKREITLSLFYIALLSGCSIGPDYKSPEVPMPTAFGTTSEKFTSEAAIVEWWKSFNDPELIELVEAAVKNNKEIDAALARLKQARFSRRNTQLDLVPSINIGADYTSTRQSTAGTFKNIPNFDRDLDLYNAGFDAVWELDLFGRIRRSIESAEAIEEATAAELNNLLHTVISEVARNYFELRGVQHQLDVARKNSSNQKETVRITRVLVKGGQATELDTARAESQYQSTLSTIPALEAAEKLSIHRIAVLTGSQPTSLLEKLLKIKDLPVYKGPVSLGNPEALLKRRPDIIAAERQLAASSAAIGIQIGNYFPKVSFLGNFGFEADSLASLGDSKTDTFAFGPRITWEVLNLGGITTRVNQSKAGFEEALARYEQSILLALEDVENSLVRFTEEKKRFIFLKKAAERSAHASALARTQYQAGLIDFLTVLDSERQTLQAQDQLAESRTALLTDLVAIYKALGGGWEGFKIESIEEKK